MRGRAARNARETPTVIRTIPTKSFSTSNRNPVGDWPLIDVVLLNQTSKTQSRPP